MIVLWPANLGAGSGTSAAARAEDIEAAGLAALACALESVSAIRGVNAKLGIHIGLAVGSVLHVLAGGFDQRFEAFLAGEACSETRRPLTYTSSPT